jgi:hypothetical protein
VLGLTGLGRTQNKLASDTRAVKILVRYLLSDKKLVSRFKPTLEVVRKMNMNQLIDNEKSLKGQNALLDLCTNMQHNSGGALDMYDFTQNERILWRLRRREYLAHSSEIRKLNA